MATHKTSLLRRGLMGWGVRLLLAAIVGWTGYLSVMQSLALVLSDRRIEAAYALAPNNGRVVGRLSQRLMGSEATETDLAQAVAIARDALRHDPTAVDAVTTLSIDALRKGDQGKGERLLAYSQTLSRRDLRTQLMAIELAVARGDIAGALHHYDIALRTRKDAPGLLYPVLVSALDDPAIRSSLVRTLAGRPNWSVHFVNHVARSDIDSAATVAFFRALQASRFPVPVAASAAMINKWLADRRFDDAWGYYAGIRPGVDRRATRNPDFNVLLEAPTAFDWIAADGMGVSTAILPDPANGFFDFTVSMGNGGLLLQQLQMLPPGAYVLEGRSIGIDQPARSLPYWTVRCQANGEIARVEVPNSSQAGGRFQGIVHVPPHCPVQTLALVARSSNEIGGVSGKIDRVILRSPHTVAP